jgi:hypothetical protein
MRAAKNDPMVNIVAVNDPFIPVNYMEYMFQFGTFFCILKAQKGISCLKVYSKYLMEFALCFLHSKSQKQTQPMESTVVMLLWLTTKH